MTLRYDDPRLELAVEAAAARSPDSPLTWLDASKLGIRRLGGIEQLTELRWLELGQNPLASVDELRGNSRLRRLSLAHAHMSSLRGLEGLPELADLDLYGSRTVAIDELEGLPLRSLDLGLCIVRELAPLASLRALESLTLGNPTIHVPRRVAYGSPDPVELRLRPIRELSSLRQLRLYGVVLPSLQVLEQLVGLEELVLDNCEIRDGFAEVPALPRLELLSLGGCEIDHLRSLTRLPRLRALNLDEAQFAELEPLLGCAALEQLSLRELGYEQMSLLDALRRHPRLRELRVGNSLWPL